VEAAKQHFDALFEMRTTPEPSNRTLSTEFLRGTSRLGSEADRNRRRGGCKAAFRCPFRNANYPGTVDVEAAKQHFDALFEMRTTPEPSNRTLSTEFLRGTRRLGSEADRDRRRGGCKAAFRCPFRNANYPGTVEPDAVNSIVSAASYADFPGNLGP